jgi:hypothetical protein
MPPPSGQFFFGPANEIEEYPGLDPFLPASPDALCNYLPLNNPGHFQQQLFKFFSRLSD